MRLAETDAGARALLLALGARAGRSVSDTDRCQARSVPTLCRFAHSRERHACVDSRPLLDRAAVHRAVDAGVDADDQAPGTTVGRLIQNRHDGLLTRNGV